MSVQLRRLVIVSHVVHYSWRDSLYAWSPYAREIGMWAELFPEVVIAAPCRAEQPPVTCERLRGSNITIAVQREVGGDTWRAKCRLLAAVPGLLINLWKVCRIADAVHVRCPGNLGLLGSLIAPLCSPYLIAKWAGQWRTGLGQSWSARLQKRILRSPWWHGPITVYEKDDRDDPRIVPFFTTALYESQMARALRAAHKKRFGSPLRVLFVGRLSADRNVDVILKAIAALNCTGIPTQCVIVGDGPMATQLKEECERLALDDCVMFTGGMPVARVPDWYERCDVLVLAGRTEGWSKAVVEAMAFGLVCITSPRGAMQHIVSEGRGFLVSPGDVAGLVAALRRLAENPATAQEVSRRGAAWAAQFSLEQLRDALRNVLLRHWRVALNGSPRVRS